MKKKRLSRSQLSSTKSPLGIAKSAHDTMVNLGLSHCCYSLTPEQYRIMIESIKDPPPHLSPVVAAKKKWTRSHKLIRLKELFSDPDPLSGVMVREFPGMSSDFVPEQEEEESLVSELHRPHWENFGSREDLEQRLRFIGVLGSQQQQQQQQAEYPNGAPRPPRMASSGRLYLANSFHVDDRGPVDLLERTESIHRNQGELHEFGPIPPLLSGDAEEVGIVAVGSYNADEIFNQYLPPHPPVRRVRVYDDETDTSFMMDEDEAFNLINNNNRFEEVPVTRGTGSDVLITDEAAYIGH